MKQIVLLLICVTATIIVHAADLTVDGVNYSWSADDGGYIATGIDEEDSRNEIHIRGVVVNERGDDFDVIAVAADAFSGNVGVERVVIDAGVATIGESAFADCHNLRYVTLSAGLKSIGQYAFSRCYSLQVVLLPEGLTTIDQYAFEFCSALTTMVIPSTVADIGSQAFRYCTGVTDVYFLMTTAAQLSGFGWWDGRYHDAPTEAGGMEFNQSRLRNPDNGTRVHVPAGTLDLYQASGKLEAWLLTEDDNSYPLWWIVNYGTVGKQYTVADDLTGVYVDVNGNLRAKDNQRWLMPDQACDGEIDYMAGSGLLRNRGNKYDQSNWVALTGITDAADYKMRKVPGGTITGTLIDKRNPEIAVTSTPVIGDEDNYILNTYIAASMMNRAQKGNDGKTYAFVRPKPQEVARIDWAIYAGDNTFYVPASDNEDNYNGKELKGGFTISDGAYEEPPMPTLEVDGYYKFDAIIRLKSADNTPSAPAGRHRASGFKPYADGGVTTTFDVLPLSISDRPIPTSVDDLNADGISITRYYNLAGHAAHTPHPGLNIVVTRCGGKITVKKVMMK